MRKQTFCICENKGADQLRSHCEADQCICFRYMDSMIPLLSTSKNSSLLPCSVLLQLILWHQPVPKPQCLLSHDVAHMNEGV